MRSSVARGNTSRPDRRTWARIKRRVLDRDGHRCQKCGTAAPLQVHHKQPVEDGGSHALDNLLSFCRGCHVAHHRAERLGPQRAAWRDWLVERR